MVKNEREDEWGLTVSLLFCGLILNITAVQFLSITAAQSYFFFFLAKFFTYTLYRFVQGIYISVSWKNLLQCVTCFSLQTTADCNQSGHSIPQLEWHSFLSVSGIADTIGNWLFLTSLLIVAWKIKVCRQFLFPSSPTSYRKLTVLRICELCLSRKYVYWHWKRKPWIFETMRSQAPVTPRLPVALRNKFF